MSNSGVPSVDEHNPLYCPEFPKSTYLKVVNRCLAHRRQKKTSGQHQPLRLLSDSSTTSERILGEFLSGDNWPSGPIDSDTEDLPPYSLTDAPLSPSFHKGSNSKALETRCVYAPNPVHGARLKRKSSESFSDFLAPPKYARSILSTHDSSFDVEVRREKLRFFGPHSSPEQKTATNLGSHLPKDIDCLVQQLALGFPGIRLEERLRALNPLTPQTITNFLVDNGHLNTYTLDTLRESDVERIVIPRSFFDCENGLNLKGNEIFFVFGKPDAFRALTRLTFSGTRLLDSDIVYFHHLPRLSVLLLDETGIANEA